MRLRPGQLRFLSDRYDAGIRWADDQLGRFLAELEASGRLAGALVVVVSDHGEELGEHGRIGHQETLHLESLRVPWILAGPGVAPAVLREPAGLADVAPTLLDLLGVEAPAGIAASLGPLLRGQRAADPSRPRFSENDWGRSLRSLVRGDHHLISAAGERALQVYDWRADPGERSELSAQRPELRDELWRSLAAHFQRAAFAGPVAPPGAAPSPDGVQRERLRSLGYVE
jgi:arylsulfatase A-like enzyme